MSEIEDMQDANEEGVAREEHAKRATEEEGGVTFANYILSDWDNAMHQFFERVEIAGERLDLTADEIRNGLRLGYGDDIADAWDEWLADD
jgi:hypothetical protein